MEPEGTKRRTGFMGWEGPRREKHAPDDRIVFGPLDVAVRIKAISKGGCIIWSPVPLDPRGLITLRLQVNGEPWLVRAAVTSQRLLRDRRRSIEVHIRFSGTRARLHRAFRLDPRRKVHSRPTIADDEILTKVERFNRHPAQSALC